MKYSYLISTTIQIHSFNRRENDGSQLCHLILNEWICTVVSTRVLHFRWVDYPTHKYRRTHFWSAVINFEYNISPIFTSSLIIHQRASNPNPLIWRLPLTAEVDWILEAETKPRAAWYPEACGKVTTSWGERGGGNKELSLVVSSLMVCSTTLTKLKNRNPGKNDKNPYIKRNSPKSLADLSTHCYIYY